MGCSLLGMCVAPQHSDRDGNICTGSTINCAKAFAGIQMPVISFGFVTFLC